MNVLIGGLDEGQEQTTCRLHSQGLKIRLSRGSCLSARKDREEEQWQVTF